MQIDERDEHWTNADTSIDESLEPEPNVTVERDPHRKKHALPSVLTEERREIDESDEQSANASAPIDESSEPDSNLTVDRDLQSKKQ
jgi:hypothetical protein